MNIFAKLMGAFAVVAVICALVGGVGWYGLTHTEEGLREVGDVRLPGIQYLGMMMMAGHAVKEVERSLLIPGLTAEQRQAEMQHFAAYVKSFEEAFAVYDSLDKTPEEAELWQQFGPAVQTWKTGLEEVLGLVSQIRLDDVETLQSLLVSRRLDHLQWVEQLRRSTDLSLLFEGQLNPALCGLGTWLKSYRSSDPEFQKILERFHEPHRNLHHLGDQVNDLIAQGHIEQAQIVFQEDVLNTLAIIDRHFVSAIEYVRSDINNLHTATELAFGSDKEKFDAASAIAYSLFNLIRETADQQTVGAKADARNSKILMAAAILLGLALALVFGAVISRKIAAPMKSTLKMAEELERGHLGSRLQLKSRDEVGQMARAMDRFAESLQNEIVAALKRLANGDLSFSIEPRDEKDEVRGALQKVRCDLSAFVAGISGASDQIAFGANQISDSSQSLSQGATEQASSLEEISASMNELGSQTKLNAENAAQANQFSTRTKSSAENGNAKMQQMVAAMSEINEAGQNIGKIIKTIDEIAFQTNLLALNAAVEAARAGQHGKGFAVVAEEVRNLAARSAKAARETAELIEGSIRKAENGSAIADETASALGEIVAGITKVSDLVGEIAAASNEQAQGIGQVNAGLGQIDQVTQQNTASAEQSASAAEELAGQAERLRQMLRRFKMEDSMGEPKALAPHVHAQEDEPAWGAGPRDKHREHDRPEAVIALDDTEFGKF